MKQTKSAEFYRLTIYLFLFITIIFTKYSSAENQVGYLETSCSEDGHYDQGSNYENNLELLLSNVTSKASTNKFYNFTTREGNNSVYGLFLCNSIYINQVCQDCIMLAKGEIQRRCPDSEEAIVWCTECMLRYANHNIFSINDVVPFHYIKGGPVKYSQFTQDLTNTFISLSHQATSGNSSLVSETTVVYLTEYITMTNYVDCTPDLSPIDCDICLQTGLGRVETDGIQAGVLLQPSCRLMYAFTDSELHPTGLEEIETMENLHFNFNAIKSATDNFSATNKLGQGGFGIVYMGTLADGQAVAVKRLSISSGKGIREFKAEACLAAKLQHKNLVKLFGFCLERNEMLLVYEFVPNKKP